MNEAVKRVLIVGGGLAGLACACQLHAAGVTSLILEGSDAVGGRVRTDAVQAFLLDRGFQVFLDAYPEKGRPKPSSNNFKSIHHAFTISHQHAVGRQRGDDVRLS